MGHQLGCKQFDTRGDPADAVPATRQMIAGTSNLMMVIGCTSDEAASVMPVLEQSHVPAFCMTGQSEFNKSSFKYFQDRKSTRLNSSHSQISYAVFCLKQQRQS